MISRVQFRQFLAVVDVGNFTNAANRLNITQPTLSMGIAELERQLGTSLFIRERRRIRLTEAGNRLLPYARDVERGFRLAESRVTSLPVPSRPIRLGVLHSFPTGLLELTLGCCEATEPLEIVEGNERELLAAISTGRLDLAVTILRDEGKHFASQKLYTEPYRLALAKDHRLAGAPSLTVNNIAGETMIARRSCEILAQTSRFFTARGARPPFSLRSANDDRVMAMVRARLGLTVAPLSFGNTGVAMVALEGFEFSRSVGLIYGEEWSALYGHDHALIIAFSDVCSEK